MLAPGSTYVAGALKTTLGAATVADFRNQGVGFMNDGSVALDSAVVSGNLYRNGIRQNASGAFFATTVTDPSDLRIGGLRVSTSGQLVYAGGGIGIIGYENGNPYDANGALVGTATSGPTDPFWANVSALLHFDGANGGTTFTDEKGNVWSRNATAVLSTAQFVFGTASLKAGDLPPNYIDTPSDAKFGYGSGDFTIEFRLRLAAGLGGVKIVYDQRTAGVQDAPCLFFSGANLCYYVGGLIRATTIATVFAVDTWYAVAISRVSGSTKLFINGTQDIITYADATNYIASPVGLFKQGDNPPAGQVADGWIDELRITKGVGRYAANYTIESVAFPNS